MKINVGEDISVDGAQQVSRAGSGLFDNSNPFVDLHLDFPVYIGEYIVGQTPFMRAAQEVGDSEMMLHSARLNELNANSDAFAYFRNCLKFYRNNKTAQFVNCAQRRFGLVTKSDNPEDINLTLYTLLAQIMAPFAFPGQDEAIVNEFNGILDELISSSQEALEAFSDEIEEKGFLKNLQHDCLEIYPRVLAAELPLRPVLFLDFDNEFSECRIPIRVSTSEFESHKDLYKDITEIVSRQMVLIAGVNNLLKRQNHNLFLPGIGQVENGRDYTPSSLNAFADVALGKKMELMDDSWFSLESAASDNHLRNSIAHYRTDYNDITQVITYYPRREGMAEERAESMMFIEFLRRILIAYREMHRLHHIIKAMFYYRYLMR